MSYFRRGLSGVQSQPQGGRVSRSALAGVQSQPSGGRVSRSALGLAVVEGKAIVKQIVTRPERPPPPPPPPPPNQVMAGRGRSGPRWYRQLAGTTLGADESTGHTLAGSTLSEPEATRKFREDLLTSNRALLEQERERARREDLRGYLQIGATLMIPVAAAIWKAIGIGKKKKKVSGP